MSQNETEDKDLDKNETQPFDLSNFDIKTTAEHGSVLELRNPYDGMLLGDEKNRVEIHLLGADSSVYRNEMKSRLNKRFNAKKDKIDINEEEKKTIRLLASMTTGWKNVYVDGKKMSYSYENAIKLYGDERFSWIREQVDEFISDRSNFLLKA